MESLCPTKIQRICIEFKKDLNIFRDDYPHRQTNLINLFNRDRIFLLPDSI